MDDTRSDDVRTEFRSLFSARSSEEEDAGDVPRPRLDLDHGSEDDQDERPPRPRRMSVDSGEGSVTSLSVTEFVILAKQLAQDNDAVDVFCKFVLTGVYEGRQYQVDPIKHAMGPRDKVRVSRDYDSV